MDAKTLSNGILRTLAICLGIFLLLYFFWQIGAVLGYITIAAVLTLMGRPIVLFLKHKLRFKNILAVLVTMLIFAGFFLGLVSLIIPLLLKQAQHLASLDVNALQQSILHLYQEIVTYLGIDSSDIQKSITESDILSRINFSSIPNFLNGLIGVFGDFSVGFFSVVFITFFLLKDSQLLERGILVFVPDKQEQKMVNSFEKIKNLLSRYFLGLLLQISILFVLYTIILLIFGIQNAVIIAFLCALLNLIPYVGPLIGGIVMLVLSMTSNIGQDFSSVILPTSMYVLIGFILGQLIDNFFSQPFIFSNSVKSHPLEIFLVILCSGILFGVLGMMVAVPAYTVVKVILKEFLTHNKIVQSLTKDL